MGGGRAVPDIQPLGQFKALVVKCLRSKGEVSREASQFLEVSHEQVIAVYYDPRQAYTVFNRLAARPVAEVPGLPVVRLNCMSLSQDTLLKVGSLRGFY